MANPLFQALGGGQMPGQMGQFQNMVQQVEPLERAQVHCVDWPSSSLCFRCSFQNSVRQ